jgi:hypothetical protein
MHASRTVTPAQRDVRARLLHQFCLRYTDDRVYSSCTAQCYPATDARTHARTRTCTGWRSWNLFQSNVNDSVMRAQMSAVLDSSRTVNGKPTTLASLGFSWISMDDGWQKCNCSTSGSKDPSLPTCPSCRTGGCSWHTSDAEGGRPVVDTRKFPNMSDLVAHGHAMGLKVGSYLNNCICMEGGDPPMGEHCTSPTHYQQDVDFIVSTGFDGVKIDNCGSSHNVTLWAQLFNRSGRHVRIESCHTFHPNNGTPSSWPNFPGAFVLSHVQHRAVRCLT